MKSEVYTALTGVKREYRRLGVARAQNSRIGPLAAVVDFVPIFDGGWLLESVLAAKAQGFTTSALNWGDHNPSLAYVGLLTLPQVVFGTHLELIFLENFLLLLLLGWFMARSFLFLCPPGTPLWEVALVGLVCSTAPPILVSVVNPSLNFATLVFGAGMFFAFMRQKAGQFAAWSTVACFSQESAAIVYAVFCGMFLLRDWLAPANAAAAVKRRLMQALVVCLPGMLLIAYTLWSPTGSFLTNGVGQRLCWTDSKRWYEFLVLTDLRSATIQNYLFNIFALNFQWAISAGLIVLVTLGFLRRVKTKVGVVIFGLVTFVYASTRCPIFNNPKYIIAALPYLPLILAIQMRAIVPWPFVRALGLTALLSLMAVAGRHSIDPLSRWFYGTFRFGEREMYHMTSRTGECCGFGQDQILYNLEFTNIHYINEMIVQTIKPGAHTVLVAPALAWTLDRFEADSFSRVFGGTNSAPFRVVEPHVFLESSLADEAYYVAYPFHDNGPILRQLQTKMDVRESRSYARDGYSYDVHILVRK